MIDEYDIEADYKDVNGRCARLEQQIIGEYIAFLRRLALHYITEGVTVYFVENRHVHWGESDFGTLYIDREEPEYVGYLTSVNWGLPKLKEGITPEKYRITAKNIDNIQYTGSGFKQKGAKSDENK